ncbi:unnamed protein product, partial [Chrysoparadoxa australica]
PSPLFPSPPKGFILLLTWGLFWGFVFPTYYTVWAAAVSAALCSSSVVTLVVCAMLDPGILPRQLPTPGAENMSIETQRRLNYCVTCHIVRPPRTKHCRHCNNCTINFDHHCPWTGNCVGKRNYRWFFFFISSVTLGSGFVCALSLLQIAARYHQGPQLSILEAPTMVVGSEYVSPILALWCLVVFLLVGSLLLFHIYLQTRGQTTNEYLRGE